MSAELRLHLPPDLPEWRRSGRFFAVAIALHLAVLAWPRSQAIEMPPPGPLTVRLIEALQPAPEPLPVLSPPPPKPAAAKPLPTRTPPVLAMTPEQQLPTAATPVVAAPPVTAPNPAPPAAVAAAPAAAAPLVAARYNAAYLNNPQPNYPALSRRLGEEGKVLLKVRVSAEGLPLGIDLEQSSSFARLDAAARQAVAGWRFVPARRGDEAVEASVIVPVVFRLES